MNEPKPGPCKKCGSLEHTFYFAAINEDGWRCVRCDVSPGEPPGFSPEHDRALIENKVNGLLHDLADAKLVHVSNGSAGEAIMAVVSAECRKRGRFDQGTITMLIVEAWAKGHAEYWAKVSDGILTGEDPRNRCPGGKLANCSKGTATGWVYSCMQKDCTSCSSGDVPF